jgi:RimJ/RimL family protein N-acetyltransferase
MLRSRDSGVLVGTVQATVTGGTAELAWVVAVPHQGRMYVREAAIAVRDRIRDGGVIRFTAHLHPHHAASAGVARALGLSPPAPSSTARSGGPTAENCRSPTLRSRR